MEEINFMQNSVDTNQLNKLYEQEKQERLLNNKRKCIDIIIKIVCNNFISILV